MTKRRVVITGVGVVSSLGNGRVEYFEGLLSGQIGIDRINGFDPVGFPCQVGGEISDLKVKQHVPKAHRKATKLMSRDIDLAVVAADWAVRDAGLKTKGTTPQEQPNIDPRRSGVNVGAGLISCDLLELGQAVEHALENGKFNYEKWGAECTVQIYPMEVTEIIPEAEWEESHRGREWLSPKQAMKQVKQPELKEMIKALAARLEADANTQE